MTIKFNIELHITLLKSNFKNIDIGFNNLMSLNIQES